MTGNLLRGQMLAARSVVIEAVRRYHRLEVSGCLNDLDSPALFVSNHGFGSILDLNVIAAFAALADMQLDRPVTVLVHEVAWQVGLGLFMERLDAQPASRRAAQEALAEGRHVLVFPGGDIDAFKTHRDRHRIVFSGRTGFARMAREANVPIVPIVTAGAGSTLLALPGGKALASALGLDRRLRLKALPVTVSIPWGLNVGLVGFLPYVPLPVKLSTCVLSPMTPEPEETTEDFALRIEAAMQDTLDRLARK